MKKRIVQFLLIVLMMTTFINLNLSDVIAASFSVSASSSSVSPGGTFSVNISVGGAGRFSISASNGSVVSSAFIDGSGSIKVTAGQSGKTTVTVTATDVTATDETPITGSKSVSVSIKSQSNNNTSGNSGSSTGGSSSNGNTSSNSGTSQSTDNKSKDNNLASLSVSTGTLSPKFSASTTTYKVDLTSDVKKISISAKANDSKATVSGTGEHELKVGENNLTVTVKAENGSKKIYTISVYVTEKPTQFIKKGNQEYGILNDLSKADLPKGFEKTTLTVDGTEVTGLKNDKLKMTLLYLQDSEQKTGFYVYENNEIISEYKTISVNGKNYVVLEVNDEIKGIDNLKTGTIKIAETEMKCWTFEDQEHANYSVVYLMNDAGEKNLYSYESTEGTLQKYVPSIEKNEMGMITYIFIGTTVVFAATSIGLLVLYMNFKKKSISAIKDYYASKNQDFD